MPSVPATTFTWSNTGGGDWTVPGNWSTDLAPTAGSDVLIDASGAYTVSLTTSVSVNAVTIGDMSATLQIENPAGSDVVAGTLENAGILGLDTSGAGGSAFTVEGVLTNTNQIEVGNGGMTAGATLTAAGGLDNGDGLIVLTGGQVVGATAAMLVNGVVPGTLAGQYHILGDTGGASLEGTSGAITQIGDGAGNAGNLYIDGSNAYAEIGATNSNSALDTLATIANNGQLDLRDGAVVTTTTGLIVADGGALYVDYAGGAGGSDVTIGGGLTNASNYSSTFGGAGAIEVGNGYMTTTDTLTVQGTLANTALINITGGTTAYAIVNVASAVSNTGGINIATTGLLGLTDGGTLTQSAGYMNVGGTVVAGSVTVTGGSLDGTGTITGTLSVDAGVVLGGQQISQPGTLTVTGAYDQSGSGVLITDLAGTGAGQFSEIAASGGAALGGTLDISPVNGFALANGDTFTALTFAPGQLTGGFSAIAYGGQTSAGAISIGNGLFARAQYNNTIGNVEIAVTDAITAFTWTNPGSGSWTNPANWSEPSVPGAGDSVVVPNLPSSATVSLSGSDSIVSLDFQGDGALSIGAGDALTVTTAVTLPGTITGGGDLEIQNQFTNTGIILVAYGTLQLDGGFTGSGTLATATGGTILLDAGATVAQIEALESTNLGTIAVNGSFSDAGQTLQVTGGTVEFQNTLTNTGSIVVDAGTLKLDNGLTGNDQITLLNGGVLDAQGGSLLLEIGAGNSFSNRGVLEASGGSVLQIDGGTLENQGGTLFAYGGQIDLTGNVVVLDGTLASADGGEIHSVAGNTVTLDPAVLPSLVNNGVYSVDANSTTVLLGPVSNEGTILDDGTLVIGDAAGDGATFTNQAGGLIVLQQNGVNITQAAAGTNTFTNDGTLEQTGGGNNYVEMPLINNGLVAAESGFFELQGGVLGGIIANQGGNIVLVGTYTLAANTTDTVTFEGAYLGWQNDGAAVLQGPGTLLSSGYVYTDQYYGNIELYLQGGITWTNAGTIYQESTIQVGAAAGDSATIVNQAGATFDLTTGQSQIDTTGFGAYGFVNAGTLEQTGGGSDYIYMSLTNTGLVTTTNGALYLAGQITNSGTLLSNGGFLELSGGGALGGTIEAVNGNNAAVVGAYAVAAGSIDTVTFLGAYLGWQNDGAAVLQGPGTLLSTGYVYTDQYYGDTELYLDGGITWDNAGTIYQQSTVQLGSGSADNATIVNQAGAVFDLTTGQSQITTAGSGTYSFANAGTLEQTGGGSDTVYTTLGNTGLITTTNGNLYLAGPITNSGTIESNGGFLEASGGGTLGGTFANLNGDVALVGTYTAGIGVTDMVTFDGAYLGWNGDGRAVLQGPGTIVSNGVAYIGAYYSVIETELAGGITWKNAGTVYQSGTLLFGGSTLDSATLINQAGAVIDLISGGAQMLPNGTGTFGLVNAGLLEETGGGTDYIEVPLTNTGTVVVAGSNNLYLEGAVTDSGTIVSDAGFVEIQGGVIGGTYEALAGGVFALIGTYTLGAGPVDTVTLIGVNLGFNGDGRAVLQGPGTLTTLGNVSIQAYYSDIEAELANGITWDNAGTIYQSGTLLFGGGTPDVATLVNQAAGVIDLTSGSAVMLTDGSGNHNLFNAGLLEQTGGGTDHIEVPLTNTGTVVAAGNNNLYIEGTVTNSGTIVSDGGFVEVQGGVLGGTYEALAGGVFGLIGTYTLGAGPVDTVTLIGVNLGFNGDGRAVLQGPGTLTTLGNVSIQPYYSDIEAELANGITWDNAGTIYQSGTLLFGGGTPDVATLVNQAAGVIDLTSGGAVMLTDGPGSYNLFNAGLLEQTGGGTDHIDVPLTNTGTVLAADSNNLYVSGPVTNSGTIVSDGGFVEVQGGVLGGTLMAINGGNFAIIGTYAAAAGTTDTVSLLNVTLGYNGDGSAIFSGPGTITSGGYVNVQNYYGNIELNLTGGVTWDSAGFIQLDGTILFGGSATDSATLVNQAGGTIDLTSGGAALLGNAGGPYLLVDAGLLEDTSGTGTVGVAVDETSSGAIGVAGGNVNFNAGGTIGGTVYGGASAAFDAGNVTITATGDITANAVSFNAGTVTLLGGTIASANLSIAGGVAVTGYGAIGDLTNNGLIDASGGLLIVNGSVGGSGSFQVETGSTLDLTDGTSQTVTFDGVDATLKLDTATNFSGTLAQFGAGDSIDLGGVTLTAASIGSNELIGTLVGGGTISFSAPNIDAGLKIALGTDPNGASIVSLLPAAVSAVPAITTPVGPNKSVTFQEVHVATADSETLAIANTATAPADGLTVSVGSITGDATATGSIASLAPGETSSAIAVGLNTANAGAESGTVSLNYVSDGSVSGVTANLGIQTLSVSGSVYRYAAPSVTAPNGVILHVGDGGGTVTEALTVANTAPADGYSEGLDASATGVASGNLTSAFGSTGDIAAGGSSAALGVTVATTTAGAVSGGVNVALTSDGTGVDTLGTTALGTTEVPFSATIDNYATAAVQQVSGPGTLSLAGNTYSIDLGTAAAAPGTIDEHLVIANIAGGPADWLSGSLSASGDAAFSDFGQGAFSTLSAGDTTLLSIDLSTANAGVFSQTITLAATDSNAAGFNEALPGETIVVTGTVLSTSQLAKATINEPALIVMPDTHVASLVANDQTVISISNTGSAVLSGAVTSASGAAYGSGAFSALAAGATDTTDIVAGLNNTSAGAKNGSVTIGFGSGATPPVPLPPQIVSLVGSVYREAAPSVTAPANVYVHVGDGGGSDTAALNVANTDPADGYSESLDASLLGVVSGGLTSATGTATGIAAGATNTSGLKLGFSTATAATINAAVAVAETSNGTGIDSLGTLNLGTVDVPVTVTVDNYATAAIEPINGYGTVTQAGSVYTLNLGAVLSNQGTLYTNLGVFNTASGPSDTLSGSLTASGGAAFGGSGFGAISPLAAGAGDSFEVTFSTDTAGISTETIVFAGTDSNRSGFFEAIGSETLVVTGTVVETAHPVINTASPIDFGNVRQTALTEQALSISNPGSVGASLDVYTGGGSGAGGASGDILGLAPGATNTTGILAQLNTGNAGVQAGALYLNFLGDPGAGGTPTYVGAGTVDVLGTVYREATPSIASPAVVYLHSGGTITEHLTVQNTAPADGYSESLLAAVTGVTGALINGGGSVSVAAGGSKASVLDIVINAGTAAGIFNGNAIVDATSDGSAIDGLGTVALGTVDVPVTYDVNNYATAALAQTGGNGILTPSGVANIYTLDLGSTQQNGAVLTASLEALNAAQGPADLLDGGFTVSGASVFSNSGFAAFSGLTAGNADTNPDIVLNTGTIGAYSETIVLSGTGSNPSGYSGVLSNETLVVTGTVLPEPPPAPPPLPTAIAWGDVHITTFDGLYYNFQAEGEFVLAQSTVIGDSFQVQARLQPYSANSTVSVITMLAAEVGADRITFGLGRQYPVMINGTGVQFGAVGETMSLGAGGSVTEVSANSYQVNWATGEVMNVTFAGSYINTNVTLSASDGPGSVQGLMGSDTGQANDFQLADGTVISQANLTSAELYGAYANVWRVTGGTSLMDYLAGQTTATFTDTNFPADSVNVDSLPAAILQVAQQEVLQAGITDPNQQQAAIVDLLVTGDPNALLSDANINQTGVVTDAAVITSPPPPVPALGVTAAATNVVETAGGTTTVTYTAYITAATGTDTVIDYAVTAPNAAYLGASAFGGALPSGYVVIAAGQTTANFTVTLPTAVLGSQPSNNLQVTISSTNGDPVFGPTAQTEIDNYTPEAGNPAIPRLSLSSGSGVFGGSNGHYTLNLGTLVAGESPLQARLQISNEALAPSDFLTGTITASGSNGFTVYGTQELTPLSAGSNFQGLVVQTNSGQAGPQTEKIVFSPVDENVTGYSAIQPAQTITVTDTVLSAAVGTIATSTPLNLGTFYQGEVASEALNIGNTAPIGSAGLDVSAAVTSGSVTAAGAITDLAPGGSNDSAVYVGLDTSSPGVKTGTVTVSYASDAGNGNTASDGGTQVQVTGTVYGPATAYLAATPLYVHQGADGGTATTSIIVSNTAPNNGYAENLDAEVVGFGPYVTAASGSTVVDPSKSNDAALTASLSTAALGSYSGSVAVALKSDGTGIDTHGITSLGTVYVPVTINVDQYAIAAFEEITGNGTLTPTGVASQYVLNLGTVAQYATPLGANLGVLNDVLGQSDLLAGGFSIAGAPQFTNAGFGAFGDGEVPGLAAQQVDSNPVVVLSTGTVGTFTETVTLTPTDYNPGGYSAVLAPETVTITGTVVAAPPPIPSARVADAWGDVHLTTFDGLYYNFQAAGEFVLAESTVAGDTFQVQARMQPLGSSSVTLDTEIAAQIGNDRVTFEAGRAATVWIDGVASSLTSLNEVVTLSGGALEETSANSYTLIWATGEQLQVTDEGSYLNTTISLPNSDAGKVQGLLGDDSGSAANDLMLPGGTVLSQPTTYAELYGQYANAWRVTDPTSLMDYGPGQDTASFTNTNFPYNQISLGNLPANAVAQAEAAAAAAGITDPNLLQAAVEDYLLTGDPDALIGSENVQQQEGASNTTATAPILAPPPVASVGVFANVPTAVESTSVANSVGFTIALTSAEANATTVDYQVEATGPGFLTAADFGGILPSGTVTIAAGQTSALFTVALPANVLGNAADENLQVFIAAPGGETVFAPIAQTEILATGPTAGNVAQPLVEQVSGAGALSGSGTSYVLNLGTVEQNGNPLIAGLGVLNNDTVPADLLSGGFVVNGSTLFDNSGLAPFTPIAAGAADTAPEVELLTDQVGTFTETITLSPTDSNATGYSASLSPVTVEITGTVAAPPPPPPPPVPVATAWGDVHLTTFDGLYYNFQAAGEFILTKSTVAGDTFQVQGRLQPFGTGSSVSVLTQIGAAVGTDDVTFGVGRGDAFYLNGTAAALGVGATMTLAGGSVTEIASDDYRVNWNTGESMTVSVGGYINDTISLTAADAGAVQGLLGPDNGNPSNDLQLPNGQVIPQPVTSSELYGAYADAWRITDPASLLTYGAGQTTTTFTDTSFPSDVLQLDQLPTSVVAAAEKIVEQGGITDPNLIQAAVIDLLVTGDPNAVFASANVQEQGVTLYGAGVSSPLPLPDVGIIAGNATAVETTSGTLAVGYTVYLTAAEAQATTITYQVTDPNAGYLGLSGIVGGTGSGAVQIAAGQTSAQITIDVLANALGSQPGSNLQVTVTPTGGEGILGATAQTEIVNPTPTAGNPAIALLAQLSGDGTLTGGGTSYDLNLGSTVQNGSAPFANLGIENGAVVPADDLAGLFTITHYSDFLNTGFDPFSNIAAGASDTEPVISLNTGTIGVFTETVVLDPTDVNASGYSAVQSDVTLTVTGTITAPPLPPPPPEPTAIAWGDVHLTTFDGLYYNFQAVGEFTLAQSTVAGDDYDVQIRTEQYSPGATVSVIDEIAAGLGAGQSVTFALNRSDTVYLNGTAQAMGVGSVLTVNGNTVREVSASSYLVTWSTGETMAVTSAGSYLSVSSALSASDGPGSVQGLLGSDSGVASDFEPVVSGTTITSDQLYGAFANNWRVTQATSLLNYAPGQTTATFTDLAFPSDALTLADLPAALQQQGLQAAIQAGITDPQLQQAAALDFIVTGDPSIVVAGQNVQQQGVTTTAADVAPATVTSAIGVSANNAALVAPASGGLSVGFTIYLTAAETTATTVDYAVTTPGAGYLDATAFGGTLPSGSVTIAAGQTSASFSVAVPAGVLGSSPNSALQVSITPRDGESVFAPTAQTTIVNSLVEPGTAADPVFALLGGPGTLTQSGNAYTLNLGSLVAGTSVENLSLALENVTAAGGNTLAGTLSASSTPGFAVSGTGPLPAIAAGSQYEDLHVAVNTLTAGSNSEIITLTPLNQNASGYSASLAPLTLTITDTVAQQNYTLTRAPTTITGGPGGDTIVAASNVLYSGDTIAPGGTSNTLLLKGPGAFDLRAPSVLSNIQSADLEDATSGQGQFIYLRSGLDLTLNVLDSAPITVEGAANNDIVNLGSGAAVVYLGGAGETVNGGSGNETFVVTATTVGAAITGGSGVNVLKVQGGGTVTMGANITGVPAVILDNAATYDFTANSDTGLVIHTGTGNDTVSVGDRSQTVFGVTGTLTVMATVAEAGVAVYGGSATTLAITNGGSVTLNAGDSHLAVQLGTADTLALSYNTSIAVQGGGGDDTLIATDGILRAGQTIAPGGGSDMLLQGEGLFDLGAPATLSNIKTVDVAGASAGEGQLVFLRAGTDLTLNVQDDAGVTVFGAANTDIIDLGSGNAVVYIGGTGETVTGASGNDTFVGTASTIGGSVVGGTGTNTLKVQGGGAVSMGGMTHIATAFLDNSASYDFIANTTTGLAIHAGTGNDTIVVGDASQTVIGSTGTLTVMATAVDGGAAFYGDGPTTLEITTSGTVTLASGDKNLTVALAAADTLVLPFNTSIALAGGGGSDTVLVTDGVLRANQTIAPGGGANTMLLQGAGLFDLRAPTTLSNIQTLDIAGASVGQSQLAFLRAGLDLTVHVQDAALVTIFGAANNDIIDVGSGNANVYVGSAAETVNGGSGNETVLVTAATIGATISGGSASSIMKVQGGGTATMGGNVTGMQAVFLDNSASYDFTANNTASMILFAGTGTDTIVAGNSSQVVIGSSGPLTVQATAALAGVRVASGSGANTLEITTGGSAMLNASDTSLTVKLDASTNLGLGGLGFITAIGAALGNDTITAGGTNQTLESIGGNDTLVGSSKFGDTFLGTSAGLSGDTIKDFGGTDAIDISDMVSSSVQPYVFNSAQDQLTVTDGTHAVTLTFTGSYSAGSFAAPVSDGRAGTLIKFV